ncbi:6-phosphogluconolactonase [Marmoricola sp. RAF53]|uniref:6-phosphogluconolactonase n=1 Tax=Marmoricola sp. RAF53 TaxID=3233059 RepID=UPI003F97A78D
MTRDIVVLSDPQAVADAVADRFLTRIRAAQERGEVPQVALTGGTVARLVHRQVAARAASYGIDWGRVVFWWGDERFVPAGDPDRNEVQAREDFLRAVGATRVHPVPDSTGCPDVVTAATRYGDLLRAEGGGAFDLVMLGMGPDGHVASLFPGFPQLDRDDTIAVPVTGSPKPPPERVSLTFAALNRSKAVWFLVTGAEKAAATARAWAFEGSVEETPARGISGPSVTWFVDEAAAG